MSYSKKDPDTGQRYRITKLQVMKSAAGYYVGRALEWEGGLIEPYERVSVYYRTKQACESALVNNDYIPVFNDY